MEIKKTDTQMSSAKVIRLLCIYMGSVIKIKQLMTEKFIYIQMAEKFIYTLGHWRKSGNTCYFLKAKHVEV